MAGEKGGSLGSLDFDQGGHRFLSTPPPNPQPSLARSSSPPHPLHDLRVFPSGFKEPQSPRFRAKRGSATSPALKIGRSQEF